MRFHYYHKVSGALHTKHITTSVHEEEAALRFAMNNAPADHIPVAGCLDHRRHRIDVATGSAVESVTLSKPAA